MTRLKAADRCFRITSTLLGCGLLLAACDQQGGDGDVMKGGGGDVTDEEAKADLINALQEGRPWVCADAGLQQTAVSIISEALDGVADGGDTPTRVMSTSESFQVAFDPQTKRMVCRSEMLTLDGGRQSTRDVTWTAQPTADGFNISVGVERTQIYTAPQAPSLD